MSYATPADLAARWRPLTPDEQTKATVLLEDASVMIDGRCPPPPIGGPLIADLPARKIVSCRMVKRAMLAAADAPSVDSSSMAAGPFSQTLHYVTPSADLYLSKEDLRLLGVGRQQAFTVSMWPEAVPDDPVTP